MEDKVVTRVKAVEATLAIVLGNRCEWLNTRQLVAQSTQ